MIGVLIPLLFAAIQLAKAFPHRHEPEPANNRMKLPLMLLLGGACVTFAAVGWLPLLFAALALICAIEFGFILAGRNPWWMQGTLDRRQESRRVSGPVRDLDPSP